MRKAKRTPRQPLHARIQVSGWGACFGAPSCDNAAALDGEARPDQCGATGPPCRLLARASLLNTPTISPPAADPFDELVQQAGR
jgi:hypothetical protein